MLPIPVSSTLGFLARTIFQPATDLLIVDHKSVTQIAIVLVLNINVRVQTVLSLISSWLFVACLNNAHLHLLCVLLF